MNVLINKFSFCFYLKWKFVVIPCNVIMSRNLLSRDSRWPIICVKFHVFADLMLFVYGYAHYMQLNYFLPKNVQFFWYDVVFKYWPWIGKHNKEVTEKMKPALSVMHAKAHAWYCQVGLNGVHKTH